MPTIAEEAGETSSGVWCHWGQVPLVGRWWLMGRGRGEGRLEITVILQTTGLASTEHPAVGSYSPILGLEWSSELNMTQLEN